VAGDEHHITGAAPGELSVGGLLFRAALLAGFGSEALPLARRLAEATRFGDGRSCLEAGTPVQLTVDAPGEPRLRVGLRLGTVFRKERLEGLVPEQRRFQLENRLDGLPPPKHQSLGIWLFWSRQRQSLYLDFRDPRPEDALDRMRAILDRGQLRRLGEVCLQLPGARPWALRMETSDEGISQMHVHWLLKRGAPIAEIAETSAPGSWSRIVQVLAHLLRRPGLGGRWVIVTPLDDLSEPALRIVNTAWTAVPEDQHKHRTVGSLMAALQGPRDYAEALWSLCRNSCGAGWKVGRACELKIGRERTRVRLYFSPEVQPATTAGTTNSSTDPVSRTSSEAEPSSE